MPLQGPAWDPKPQIGVRYWPRQVDLDCQGLRARSFDCFRAASCEAVGLESSRKTEGWLQANTKPFLKRYTPRADTDTVLLAQCCRCLHPSEMGFSNRALWQSPRVCCPGAGARVDSRFPREVLKSVWQHGSTKARLQAA